jgi:hypothetical protein
VSNPSSPGYLLFSALLISLVAWLVEDRSGVPVDAVVIALPW